MVILKPYFYCVRWANIYIYRDKNTRRFKWAWWNIIYNKSSIYLGQFKSIWWYNVDIFKNWSKNNIIKLIKGYWGTIYHVFYSLRSKNIDIFAGFIGNNCHKTAQIVLIPEKFYLLYENPFQIPLYSALNTNADMSNAARTTHQQISIPTVQ